MKNNREKMASLSYYGLLFVAGILLVWAVVSIVLSLISGSGFSPRIWRGTNDLGTTLLFLLVAFGIINIVSTLSRIADNLKLNISGEPEIEKKEATARKKRKPVIIISGLVVILVAAWVLATVCINRYQYNKVSADTISKLESLSSSSLVKDLANAINRDTTVDVLADIHEAAGSHTMLENSLIFIVPIKKHGVPVYYQLTSWTIDAEKNKGKKLSEATLIRYVPIGEEINKFEELEKGKISHFSVPYFGRARVFVGVQSEGVLLVLHADREIRESSFK